MTELVQRVAIADRHAYGATGVSTRQRNEPDGGQDVWHLHVHVFPRYADDHLYGARALQGFQFENDRAAFAEPTRRWLAAS